MPLTFKMVASEILICGLKKVPVAGNALEVVDAIRARHEMTGHADRLSSIEGQLSRFEKRQRDLVAEEMRSVLENLGRPGLGGPALSEEMRNLRQIQEQGWSASLFEGLLLNSSHRDELKRNPQHYGRILGDHDKVDEAKGIHLLLDADKTRILEVTPFAFSQLLANQAKGVPEAKLQVADGVWAFPNSTSGGGTGSAVVENSVGMKMVRIEPGSFTMGSDQADDEKPPHLVRITKPFHLAAHQVTQGQYQAVVGHNTSHFKGSNDLPVDSVSWFDAVYFCNKLSEREKRVPYYKIVGTSVSVARGSGYRLPTEAQWEYACRAGTTTPYPFGFNDAGLGEYAWFDGNSEKKTHPVGLKRPNDWGLYDTLGNVWEWCEDWYNGGYYKQSPKDDPVGPPAASARVVRGGGWLSAPEFCRPAARGRSTPGGRNDGLGFRVAAVL